MEEQTPDFKVRQDQFEKELTAAMDEYKISIYAANVVMPNGEVMPVLKVADINKPVEKKDADKTKGKSIANKKA